MSQKIKTLIVDDEEYARDIIRLLLKEDLEIEIVGECSNGVKAIEFLKSKQPQLVFLDIQMPEINGFEVISALKDIHIPYYIFTTAYDQYALKAFEVNAIDYLLKPYTDERFEQALLKAKNQIYQQSLKEISQKFRNLLEVIDRESHENKTNSHLKKVSIRTGSKIKFLNVNEIDWIEADDQYVKIHIKNDIHLLRETMNYFEKSLDPDMFYRIHRSTIVNIERIEEIQPYFKNDYIIILNNKEKLKLSRNRKENLQKVLGWK